MTTLSASDIAARRIREARQKRGWRVKDLAGQCEKAGFPRLTPAVITTLETRRRPGREISAEELLALAQVLGVPPLQLLCPLDGGETLAVTPGEAKDPLDAAGWLTDDDAAVVPVRRAMSGRAGDTERMLRDRGTPLTVLRQIRSVTRSLRTYDRATADDAYARLTPGTPAFHENSVTVLALRLLHLTAALGQAGYSPPALDGAMEILARHGLPATLAEWDELAGESEEEEEVPGVESA